MSLNFDQLAELFRSQQQLIQQSAETATDFYRNAELLKHSADYYKQTAETYLSRLQELRERWLAEALKQNRLALCAATPSTVHESRSVAEGVAEKTDEKGDENPEGEQNAE